VISDQKKGNKEGNKVHGIFCCLLLRFKKKNKVF
jgi:hypothetical protein